MQPPTNSLTLDSIEIGEVFEYYDRPCLFSCRDRVGQDYLALWVDESDDAEVWLYVAVSPSRLDALKAGDVELRNAFLLSEAGTVLVVKESRDSQPRSIESITATEIPPEWLPKPGESLYRSA